jgi:hypothetical protein
MAPPVFVGAELARPALALQKVSNRLNLLIPILKAACHHPSKIKSARSWHGKSSLYLLASRSAAFLNFRKNHDLWIL